jgi:hypothetical protein
MMTQNANWIEKSRSSEKHYHYYPLAFRPQAQVGGLCYFHHEA